MVRFVLWRVICTLIALVVVVSIVFFLTRLSGKPLDVMCGEAEAAIGVEDFERMREHWDFINPYRSITATISSRPSGKELLASTKK